MSSTVLSITDDCRTSVFVMVETKNLRHQLAEIKECIKRIVRCFEYRKLGYYRNDCSRKRKQNPFIRYNMPFVLKRTLEVVGLVIKNSMHTRMRVNGKELACLRTTGTAISSIDEEHCPKIGPLTYDVQTVSGLSLKNLSVAYCWVKICV